MIRVFEATETNFNHNENLIRPYSAVAEERANGMYELTIEAPLEYNNILKEWNIIQVPTSNDLQLFRIHTVVKTLDMLIIYASHIFYDLNNNFLDNIRPTNMNTSQVLNHILANTKDTHPFVGFSDVNRVFNANYVRKSPVEAIMSGDNAILNRWGGFLIRDNFNIKIVNSGRDNGYKIEYGKNILGVDVEIDLNDVVTRVMPTWVNDTNVVQYLPERYIDSPIISNYPFPITKELRLTLTESLSELPLSELHDYVKNYVEEQWKIGLDKPKINIKVDFLELSNFEEYKEYSFLETLQQYEKVQIKIPKLDLELESVVIFNEYDCLEEKFTKLELGNFKTDLATSQKNFFELQETINSEDFLTGAINNATNLITGNNGGYVVLKTDANNKPYEILIMDTDNIQTALKVWRWNKNGLGFSNNGYSGPYNTAITNDGKIVADFILAGIFNGNLIRTGAIEGGTVSWNLDTGALNVNNDIIYNPTTKTTTLNNTVKIANGIIESAHIKNLDARYFTLDGITLDNFISDRIKTNGFELNNNGNFTLSGNSVAVSGNSSYLTIKDTGGRGQVDVNGTIRAMGSGYNYEINAGGFKLDQAESCALRYNGGAEMLYYGGASVKVSGNDIYLSGKRVIFDSGGTLKWV